MDNGVFFSVIIPVYNVEPYLKKCVDSVLGQTFRDFEVILVDDGSSDQCPQICDAYARQDARVVVIHKENGGAATARNIGMASAKGVYISFLDADDFWIRNTVLADIHQSLMKNPVDILILKMVRYYQETDTFSTKYNAFSERDFSADDYETKLSELIAAQAYRANPWNKVFRRSLMERNNLAFTEGVIAEDVDWAARLSLAAKSINILPNVVHAYRFGRPGSVTSVLKLKNLMDTKENIERCVGYVENISMSVTFQYAYYSYIAYRYVIWMAESAALHDPAKNALIREMKQYSWLLNYDGMKRVKMVKRVHRILGFRITSALLGLYLKHRTI